MNFVCVVVYGESAREASIAAVTRATEVLFIVVRCEIISFLCVWGCMGIKWLFWDCMVCCCCWWFWNVFWWVRAKRRWRTRFWCRRVNRGVGGWRWCFWFWLLLFCLGFLWRGIVWICCWEFLIVCVFSSCGMILNWDCWVDVRGCWFCFWFWIVCKRMILIVFCNFFVGMGVMWGYMLSCIFFLSIFFWKSNWWCDIRVRRILLRRRIKISRRRSIAFCDLKIVLLSNISFDKIICVFFYWFWKSLVCFCGKFYFRAGVVFYFFLSDVVVVFYVWKIVTCICKSIIFDSCYILVGMVRNIMCLFCVFWVWFVRCYEFWWIFRVFVTFSD